MEGDVQAFLGVPYAAPPVGDMRFALPAAHERWHGVRDASQPGPTAPQFIRDFPVIDVKPLVGTGWHKGEDFLTANIWTPGTDRRGLPVMVFVHGGAFAVGSNNSAVNNGAAFARSGVVCIGINYRLGIEGFLPIHGIPTNLGLRDILFALEWVKANAAAFGGDPENITLFGESAGAMAIGLLLGSPLAKGLFRRAILQSGHASTYREPQVAGRVLAKTAEILNVSPDITGFGSRTMEECVGALEVLTQPTTRIDLRGSDGHDSMFGITKVGPVLDDDILPRPPLAAIADGLNSDVEVLIGTNREEMNLYFVPTGVRALLTDATAVAVLGASHSRAEDILRDYGLGQPGSNAGEVFTTAMHDLMFRAPARILAATRTGPTHFYEFDWRSPACSGQLGACHGLELPFVFNTLATCTAVDGVAGENPPQSLADSVHGLWLDFARGKRLPWPAFLGDSRSVYSLYKREVQHELPLIAETYLS
jgi:para-nitrobenzyl esterase